MTFTTIGATSGQLARREDGAKRGGTELQTSHGNTNEIVQYLISKRPADIDKAAVSRMRSHGVEPVVKYRTMFPENAPAYEVAISCTMHGGDQIAAAEDMEKFLTPAPIRQIEAWLAELSVLTAGKGREGLDAELAVTAYSARLSKFPADVVRYALIEKTWKWFPSWAELEKVCRAKESPRRVMLAALRSQVQHEEERRLPTEEERARIAAFIAEQFPQIQKAWRDEAERRLAGEA